jgi:hypothetical protein
METISIKVMNKAGKVIYEYDEIEKCLDCPLNHCLGFDEHYECFSLHKIVIYNDVYDFPEWCPGKVKE